MGMGIISLYYTQYALNLYGFQRFSNGNGFHKYKGITAAFSRM